MQHARQRRRGLGLLVAGATGLVTSLGTVAPSVAAVVTTHTGALAVSPVVHGQIARTASQGPPTTAQCKKDIGIACYSPLQYQAAYGTTALYNEGLTGAGKTIFIVDAFGSPTIRQDVAVFDQDFGLPPIDLDVIQPAGAPPAFNPKTNHMENWAFETTLDVEYAHAIAPGAHIVLAETPTDETEGVTGLPEMMDSELYGIKHHLADVISQSFGATEDTFPSSQDIMRLRYAFTAAQKHNVSVLGASGDLGATDFEMDLTHTYPYRVNSWPSSDPLVTSVGGTQLFLNQAGQRIKQDRVWNDGFGAGGGGQSHVFSRPSFQDGVASIVGTQRGTPDVSLTAAVDGAALVYLSFLGKSQAGYYLVGGTSEATPIFAGVVAIADQAAGHDLGDLNPLLYSLAGQANSGIVDVTKGNNSFAGVPGFQAKHGYDMASGLGTVDAYKLVHALAGT
jgi:subtilase family serine protease